jgi:hypothetical protein
MPLTISQAEDFVFLDLAKLRLSSGDDSGLCTGPPLFSGATTIVTAELKPEKRTWFRLGSS